MVGAGRERSEPPSSARAGRCVVIPPQHLRRVLVDIRQTTTGASSSTERGRGKTKRAARGARCGTSAQRNWNAPYSSPEIKEKSLEYGIA